MEIRVISGTSINRDSHSFGSSDLPYGGTLCTVNRIVEGIKTKGFFKYFFPLHSCIHVYFPEITMNVYFSKTNFNYVFILFISKNMCMGNPIIALLSRDVLTGDNF